MIIYVTLLTIILVKVKCNLFFRISFVFSAYAICFTARFARDIVRLFDYKENSPYDTNTLVKVFEQIDSISSTIKLFMVFFFILQVSLIRAKVESETP